MILDQKFIHFSLLSALVTPIIAINCSTDSQGLVISTGHAYCGVYNYTLPSSTNVLTKYKGYSSITDCYNAITDTNETLVSKSTKCCDYDNCNTAAIFDYVSCIVNNVVSKPVYPSCGRYQLSCTSTLVAQFNSDCWGMTTGSTVDVQNGYNSSTACTTATNATTGIVAGSGLCCKTNACNTKYVKPATPLPPNTVTIVANGQTMLGLFIGYAIQYVVIYILFTMTESIIVQFIEAIRKKTIFGMLIFMGWSCLLMGTCIQLPFIIMRQTSSDAAYIQFTRRFGQIGSLFINLGFTAISCAYVLRLRAVYKSISKIGVYVMNASLVLIIIHCLISLGMIFTGLYYSVNQLPQPDTWWSIVLFVLPPIWNVMCIIELIFDLLFIHTIYAFCEKRNATMSGNLTTQTSLLQFYLSNSHGFSALDKITYSCLPIVLVLSDIIMNIIYSNSNAAIQLALAGVYGNYRPVVSVSLLLTLVRFSNPLLKELFDNNHGKSGLSSMPMKSERSKGSNSVLNK